MGKTKQIIFGIGCGGCGTVSLYTLFMEQKIFQYKNSFMNKMVVVKHEGILKNNKRFLLNKPSSVKIQEYVNNYLQMIDLNKEYEQYENNNVINYYQGSNSILSENPNYHINVALDLLYYIDEFLKQNQTIKVVCLKKAKDKTIKSLIQKTLENSMFSFIFGKYIDNPDVLKNKIGLYYDDYYNEVKKLLDKYPNNIKIYDISLLRNKIIQKQMLIWCRFKYPSTKIAHENKRDGLSYKESLYKDYVYANTKAIHSKQLELSLKGGCKSLTIIIDKFGNKTSCALNEKGDIIRCCDL